MSHRTPVRLLPALLLLAGLFAFAGPPGLSAQEAAQETPATAAAPAARAEAVPATKPAGTMPAPAATMGFGATLAHAGDYFNSIHQRVHTVIPQAISDLQRVSPMVRAMSPESGRHWLIAALSRAAVTIALALAAAFLLGWLVQRPLLRRFPAVPSDHTTKVCFVATRGLIGWGQAVVVLAVGVLLNDLGNTMDTAEHVTGLVAVVSTAATFLVLDTAYTLFWPKAAAYRMIPLPDADARALWRDTLVSSVLVSAAISIAAWFRHVPIGDSAFILVYIVTNVVATALIISFIMRQRHRVARAILGSTPEHDGGARRLFAYSWHILATIYFLAALVFASERALLGIQGYLGLLTGPIAILAVGYGCYGLALVLIESVFRNEQSGTEEAHAGRPMPSFRRLAEQTAAIVIVVLGIGAIFQIWGVNLLAMTTTLGGRLFAELVVVLLAYLAYQATKIAIDAYLVREAMREDPHAFHGASSRLGTLLSLFRGFALISIVVMAVMVGLSQLGINIAPLFAGAGVIGLAVGFGSQTLIKDIFSGAFFLIDDAFRRGEYIDIGVAKGTVEKISVRSLQLRHQNGPLYTVPFGNIHSVSNFSRDWVIMKLPIRLAYGTDPEMVRKIVKKIAEEFEKDPENGPKFLEPLKSQGVYEMDDSGLTFRVKFMTKPGDNFVLRRLIYQRMQEKLQAAGIQFAANRAVTVRVQTDGTIDQATASKATVAALPMVLQAAEEQEEADSAANAR